MNKLDPNHKFETVVIDGDWILYLISCTCENTYIEVKDTETSIPQRHKNITEFKKTIHKDSISTVRDDYVIENKKELKNSSSFITGTFSVRAKIAKIVRETNSERAILALAGKSNFRDRIALPIKYKGHRDSMEKPLVYEQLKEHVIDNFEVIIAQDQEADDILSINQHMHKDNGKSISCTLDKDNRSVPGYLHNPKENTITFIEGLGNFKLVEMSKKKKLYGHGRCWEYIQWIIGDPVDNYHPLDLLSKTCIDNKQSNCTKIKRKISDVKVFKDVEKFTTDKQWLQYIHDLYYSWYHDLKWYKTWDNKLIKNCDYIDILQCYVDCAHMRRWENDRVDIRQVLKNQQIID